jgi:peptidoglycan/xylan/chitin deacetylase (PgdA/CDA1 family)
MSPFKNLFYHSCSFLSMQLLQNLSPVTTLLPYHHTVSNEALPHIQHLYSYKNEAQFKKDLDTLLKYNKPISAGDLSKCINENKPIPKHHFLLTFDDGFREVYDVIAPLLESKGVPAVFFIVPSFIDNKELFFRCKTSLLIHQLVNNKKDDLVNLYREHFKIPNAAKEKMIHTLKNIKSANKDSLDELAYKTGYSFSDFLTVQQPFLTTGQLTSLHKRGFTIGAHSINHPYYDQLSLADQLEQTIGSCKYVQQITGNQQQYFSFPFSEENLPQQLFNELNKSGIDLLFGLQNQKIETANKMVHRFNAERPSVILDEQLKGILLLSLLRKWMGKNKVHRN